ncbi:MAG: hypothetical protein GEV10_06360 [Streptosporangiales bacterium]|nr:hypothetical protein [Streptosporangiales bacterium]
MIKTDADNQLLCPSCGAEWVHTDIVYVSARHEDGSFNEISVNGVTGQVVTNRPEPGPVGPTQNEGRRHRMAVTGWCEHCPGRFALVFTQHKGVTFVETVSAGDRSVQGDPV